jgi:hypothetical protein
MGTIVGPDGFRPDLNCRVCKQDGFGVAELHSRREMKYCRCFRSFPKSGIELPKTRKSALQVDEAMAAGRLLSQTKINNS